MSVKRYSIAVKDGEFRMQKPDDNGPYVTYPDYEKLESECERYRDALLKIQQWAEAYPIEVFPEPDFKQAEIVLKAAGMGITNISASNMRHVLTGVKKIVEGVLKNG